MGRATNPFFNFLGPYHIAEAGKLGIPNFGIQIDRGKYTSVTTDHWIEVTQPLQSFPYRIFRTNAQQFTNFQVTWHVVRSLCGLFHSKFTAKFVGERIARIGQSLAKLQQKY